MATDPYGSPTFITDPALRALLADPLPPRLGPELVDWATDAQQRAVTMRREADALESDAELCFAAIDRLNGMS